MKEAELRVRVGKKKVPFSAGQVVDGLQAAGVLTDDALRVAHDVEARLRREGRSVVPLADLRDVVADEVRAQVGDAPAARWSQQTPPFVPIVLERQTGEDTPFSRRTLIDSLEKLGLGFKEAWALATQVEQGIRAEGLQRVGEGELPQRVALALEARYGREQRVRYEATLDRPSDLLVVEPDGSSFPYSRGVLARSLTAIGLGQELSHGLAKRVEEQLWRTGGRSVERSTVRYWVQKLLLDLAGEEFARRYELMRSVRRPERPMVVLVGGTAGVGKSELAAELAYRLGIVRVVSSDSIRQALRSLISEELSPVLHESSYTAWLAELLPAERAAARPKLSRVIRGFQAQVLQLGTALQAVGTRNVNEATSVVIEGIHVVPGVSPGRIEGATVIELMLQVPDEETHRNRFARREGKTGHQRPKDPYLTHFSEIRMLQDYLIERAHDVGVPVVDVSDLDAAVERSVDHVLDFVLADRERQMRSRAARARPSGTDGGGALGEGAE